MLIFLKCVGIIIAGLIISKILVGLTGMINQNKSIIDKESKNIAYYARKIADYLCLLDENDITYFDYNTAFYEEFFFLTCLEAVRLINNNIDNKMYGKIKFKALNYTNNFDGIKKYNTVKNIVDNAFQQRSMFYMSLINSCNYKINKNFFAAVLDYQVNIFSSNNKYHPDKIRSILEETLPAIKEFYNNYV